MVYKEESNDGLPFDGAQRLSAIGITPLLAALVSLSVVLIAVPCLYCFYPRSRKKSFADDEESRSSSSDEIRNVNATKTSMNATESQTRKASSWTKISSFFQNASASDELDYRLRRATLTSHHIGQVRQNSTSSGSNLFEKPAMGDVRTSYVQPPARDNLYANTPPSAVSQKRKSLFTQDSFKLPFDPWLISDDTPAPQGTDYRGRLEFSVAYAFDSLTLVLKVVKAVDLPAMDLSGTSDPFVKCCLLPDRKRKLETKIRRKTLNPSWNETLLFEGLSYDKIQQRVLFMQVMDWDRFSRNDPIGEICLPLHQIDLTNNQPQWEYLTPTSGSNKRGELLVSLCYHPVEGRIDVLIKEARNLKPMDIGGTSDPYVKIWQLVRGKRTFKCKTATIKNSLNPNFEEKFIFESPMERLRETQLEISVMDRDKIGRNDTIGKIYLGTKSNSLEKRHWKEMLTKVRQPVEQWHILKV